MSISSGDVEKGDRAGKSIKINWSHFGGSSIYESQVTPQSSGSSHWSWHKHSWFGVLPLMIAKPFASKFLPLSASLVGITQWDQSLSNFATALRVITLQGQAPPWFIHYDNKANAETRHLKTLMLLFFVIFTIPTDNFQLLARKGTK